MKIYLILIKNLVIKILPIVITLLLYSCSTTPLNQGQENKSKHTTYLITPNSNVDKTVEKLIDLSSIRLKGYVVIIPVSMNKNDKKAAEYKNSFYRHDIMAVHIFNMNPNYLLKNTDKIMIENAAIICFVGDRQSNREQFRKWAFRSGILAYLKKAVKNGTLTAGNKEIIKSLQLN
jgi:hypothetical protein